MTKTTSQGAEIMEQQGTCRVCGKPCHYRAESSAPLARAYWVHSDTGSHRGDDGHDCNSSIERTRPTCTVVTSIVAERTCGARAVMGFTGRDGATYFECAEHARTTKDATGIEPGVQVYVHAHGLPKIGTVVNVAATRCSIAVPLRNGSPKIIHRRISEVEVVR